MGRLLGAILVGFTSDSITDKTRTRFSTAARNSLLTVTGVDAMIVAYHGKFNFVSQIGSPQKAVYELRDGSVPCALGLDVLVRGM